MSEQENKKISVNETIVVKKSPGCREVAHKANASLSEEELIKKHTVGELDKEADEREKE